MLRGVYYNNHLAHKCPNCHLCVACKKCINFNRHNAMCQFCERGQNYGCTHTEVQKTKFLQIEMLFKRPIFEKDAKLDQEDTTRIYQDEMELDALEKSLDGLSITAQNVR